MAPPTVTEVSGPLTPGQRAAVLALAESAGSADGVAPLSEQTLLDVRHGAQTHLLGYAVQRLVGYSHLSAASAAELVTDPGERRRGAGSALLDALMARAPEVRLWAHGDLLAARGFAAARGLRAVRELLQLGRPLAGADQLPAPRWPDGFTVRTFRPGQDEQAWLETNAAAFADHPEQGRVTLADLREREAEAWFDPAGFFLVVDDQDPGGPPAAFHWTKVVGQTREDAAGEVYVVGVHPAYQGRGLGRAVMLLGLRHLAARGLPRVLLYVEGDNAAGRATYAGLGFTSVSVDVMYAR